MGLTTAGDWQQCLKVYGLTEAQALEYKLNPVDNLEALAKAKVPLLHVCGDADEVVPIDENTRLVEKRYAKLGGPMTVIAKAGVGHHPHSLENPALVVTFVLKHTIGGSAALILPESPSEYRVFQRQSWDAGPIRLRGRLVAEAGQLRCRLTSMAPEGKTPTVVRDWQPVAADLVKGRSDAAITAPAGGWYRVELRLERAGEILVEVALEHVGVGEVFVVAGQSNATNYGSEKQKVTSGLVASFDGTRWVLANDPQPGVQDGSKNGSFLPAFGDALVAKYKVPIGVASTGAGATSVREWLPRGERSVKSPPHISTGSSRETQLLTRRVTDFDDSYCASVDQSEAGNADSRIALGVSVLRALGTSAYALRWIGPEQVTCGLSWRGRLQAHDACALRMEALYTRRFLQHVLPAGFARIRHYVILGNRRRKVKLELCVSVRDGLAGSSVALSSFRCRP